MSLANIQGKLSRAEMKKIMAGSGGNCNTYSCSSNSDCGTQQCGNRCFSVSGKNRCVSL